LSIDKQRQPARLGKFELYVDIWVGPMSPGRRRQSGLAHADAVLYVLAGAPGAGKTAAVGPLRQVLGGVVVLDMDEFLEPAGVLAGADLHVAAEHWPAYGELCQRLVGAVVASGVDCLLLTPLEPDEVGPRFAGARWAVLDCADGMRRQRLARRPMDPAGIEDALRDAAWLRTLGLPVLSSAGTVADTGRAVADWVRASAPAPHG
jgi:hypothetical protein